LPSYLLFSAPRCYSLGAFFLSILALFLARLAPQQGFGNRLNKLLFSNRAMSRVSYPLLRFGRNALLRLLGRPKISQQQGRR